MTSKNDFPSPLSGKSHADLFRNIVNKENGHFSIIHVTQYVDMAKSFKLKPN